MEIQNLMSASIIVGAATATSVPVKEAEKPAAESADQQQTASMVAEAPETESLALDANAEAQQGKEEEQGKEKEQGKLNEESVSELTKELNELMENINCDLQFKYNKEVDVMTVKMVDKKTDEVLREYPPEEMVKNMIKAREWIGAFLDRQA